MLQIKELINYLVYAFGLIVIALLIIPKFSFFFTLWFVAYLLTGIFFLHKRNIRTIYFLVNLGLAVVGSLINIFSLLIALAMTAGFVFSAADLGYRKKKNIKKKEFVREYVADERILPKLQTYNVEEPIEDEMKINFKDRDIVKKSKAAKKMKKTTKKVTNKKVNKKK